MTYVLALLCCAFLSTPLLAQDGEEKEPIADEATFAGLELRNIGPALMSGRIADIAVHPVHRHIWYVAVGSGNLWKTVNAGTTWETVFDNQASYSIGDVTLDPNRPDTVWLGTGENTSGRHVGYGDGVYRSLDGGKTWTNMGLKDSQHIGNIVIDPRDSDVVFVAAQGPLWSAGGERGLFKTTDGGKTWKNVLSAGEYTGVNEVHMDPRNPDVLIASTQQRARSVAALINGGPESGIHKSTDGGETWREVTKGLPEEDMGRIGLAISPVNPDVVYATIELRHRKGGFWRSLDGGESWEKRNDYLSGGTGPHYYQEIFASPHDVDEVYQMDVRMHVTRDGGKNFSVVPHEGKHSDNHALIFHPDVKDYLLSGNDGGLYETFDRGESWRFIANLPVTQFYKIAVDNDEPFYNVYGGTQDNNTQGGPSRTDSVHGIRNSDWFVTLFGDGHQPATDPTNPDIVYSEWQQGNLVRYDRKNGEIVYIQPQPEAGEPTERFNWDSPILVSPHDPKRLYHASQRLWRSDDRGDSWRAVSGDLSRGVDRLTMPLMDRVWSIDSLWDVYAMSTFGNITSVSESPIVEGLLYAGTDDGLVHVSEDGGDNWRRIDELPGVPDNYFVNDIKADLHDADTVYVIVDNHKQGDFAPYILKSTDRGRSWDSIAGNLPERHLVWRLVQDHVKPELLFAGTEFGVFFTVDGGDVWTKLSGNVPTIPFRDLAIQQRENDLVGGTFGRGIFILDDYTPLREVSPEMLEAPVTLFPTRAAKHYMERGDLGLRPKASQGAAFYIAPNPPFGAVFTYYMGEGLKTSAEARREREKPIKEAGGDTPTPGWDTVTAEDREDEPTMILTVTDSGGNVVRHVEGPAKKGFNRVAWDLRYPLVDPWKPESQDAYITPLGVLAAPGRYSVELFLRVNGVTTSTGQKHAFDVVSIREATLPGSPPDVVVAFARDVAELQRQADGAVALIDETKTRLGAIRDALMRSTAGDATLDRLARDMQVQLHELRDRLAGNQKRGIMGDPGPVSINQRLQVASIGNRFGNYGPTPTHRRAYEIARDEFGEVQPALQKLATDALPALEERLEAAGVPWTPGRVPGGGR
ncbi:MAG: glycosyl hydrolase [Pseudomonadota bacterium]